MGIKQVVAAGNLGAEFDVGVEEADKIHVKLDGVTVVRGADGVLRAMKLARQGDGTVLVTPADGGAAWSFDPCCSRPWEKYGGKVCYQLPAPGGTPNEFEFALTQLGWVSNTPGPYGIDAVGNGGTNPRTLHFTVVTDVAVPLVQSRVFAVPYGTGTRRVRWTFTLDGLVSELEIYIRALSESSNGEEYLDTFSVAPSGFANVSLGGLYYDAALDKVHTDAGAAGTNGYMVWENPPQTLAFDAVSTWSNSGFWLERVQATEDVTTPGGVREAFVWDDHGTPRYQDVESGALVVNPTIVACA